MTPKRPNLTPAYIFGTVAFFCAVGIAIALISQPIEISALARNLLIVAMFAAVAGMLAILIVAVTAVDVALRIPSPTRELAEMREQLQHIATMLRTREPHEDDTQQMVDNIARLQQNSAQSQQDLSQLQEMMRQMLGRLDALRSVATVPSPAAVALEAEADDSGVFPVLQVPEHADPAEAAAEAIEDAPAPVRRPAFTFKPTPPKDETPAEQFDSLDAARVRVEDLMALSNWDTALSIAKHFADHHQDDPDAQWLRQRVQREFDIYREGSVRRLYEQIKEELERKHYRRALSIARRLLDKFPDHKRSQKIRTQLPTILENAEIEERQEDESRIQQYIKSKRFQDAVELGEALLAKYPMSPQAESLEDILPKLRQRAIEQEAETLGQR